jgi:hypothetical protein
VIPPQQFTAWGGDQASQSSGVPGTPSAPQRGHGSQALSSILSLNIRGLLLSKDKTKCDQLSDMAKSNNALVIALTETWLTSDIMDAEIAIPGFNVYRADRVERSRGGTCVYVRDDLAAVPVLQFSNGVVEAVVLKIRDLESIVFSIYRPPDTKEIELSQALRNVEESIELSQANSGKFSNVIGLGDYNLPMIQWPEGSYPSGDSQTSRQAGLLLTWMQSLFLEQKVLSPTRLNNVLDLVLMSNQEQFSHVTFEEHVALSDHTTVTVFLFITKDPPNKDENIGELYKTTVPLYNMKMADTEDWVRYRMMMDRVNWTEEAAGLRPRTRSLC